MRSRTSRFIPYTTTDPTHVRRTAPRAVPFLAGSLRRRRAFARRVARLPRSHQRTDESASSLYIYRRTRRRRRRRRLDRTAWFVVVSSARVRSRRIALSSVRARTRSCGRGRSWTRASSATRARTRSRARCEKGNFYLRFVSRVVARADRARRVRRVERAGTGASHPGWKARSLNTRV